MKPTKIAQKKIHMITKTKTAEKGNRNCETAKDRNVIMSI